MELTVRQTLSAERELNRLTIEFTTRTPSVTHAIVVCASGLPLASGGGLPKDQSDRLAAAVSGLSSLAEATARIFEDARAGQTVIEMANGFLFLLRVERGASIALFTSSDADLGVVGYELALFAERTAVALVEALKERARNRI